MLSVALPSSGSQIHQQRGKALVPFRDLLRGLPGDHFNPSRATGDGTIAVAHEAPNILFL